MRVLLDDESCRVEIDDAVIAQAERLIVTFAGIGPGKRPQGVPAPEFLGSASRYGAVVSVADKRRSWGNMLDVPRVSDAIRRIADGRPISTLGNSMGGFLAVLFSTPLQATHAVAVAAQFSISHSVIPNEHRWNHFGDKIRHWWYPSLIGHFNLVTRYTTLNGSIWQEKRHWNRFPRQQNCQHYIFDGFGHDVAARLKERGILVPILDFAFRDGSGDLNDQIEGIEHLRLLT